MFSSDHIVSFTLSALLHALGLLAVGFQVLHRPAAEQTAIPELVISSVELSLTEDGPELPGAAPAETEALLSELPPLELPRPVETPPAPKLPDKADFSDALPPPEPVPEPVTAPAPLPAPAPQPPPKPAPQPRPAAPPPAAPAPAPAMTPAAGGPAAPVTLEPGGGGAGQIDALPSLERSMRPHYPLGSRRLGEEGTVVLDVWVGPDGSAARTTLVSSSGFPELDRAAERAASQARFKPGTRNGRPIESAARLTLIFRLRDL